MEDGLLQHLPVENLNLINDQEDDEYIDEDTALEIMRSLPSENISALICDSIFNSKDLEFLNVVNIREGNVNLLVAPSIEDKIILIDAIEMCLSKLMLSNTDIKNIIRSVLNIYNKSYLGYIELSDINYYDIFVNFGKPLNLNDLSFLADYCVATIINKIKAKSKLTISETNLFKTQMFIYASVWFDMDKYLKYLYYLYK